MMQRLRFFLKPTILLLASLLLLIQPVIAQDNTEEQTAIERVEQVLQALEDNSHFSGVALIAQDGEILLHQSYGYANQEWEIPNSPDSRFRIGDLTSQFTAMLILQMHERGELDIHDSICDYLDPCADEWNEIQIRHLIQHTSGLPYWTDHEDFDRATMLFPPRRDMYRMLTELPLYSEPGEVWNYNLDNFLLLGEIIDNASGMRFESFLNANILEPLAMENTGVDNNRDVIGNRAEGYEGALGDWHTYDPGIAIAPAARSMYSTTGDLYIWNQALFNYEVISEETWNMMIDEGQDIPGFPGMFHYGIVEFIGETDFFMFTGYSVGFSNLSVYIPSNDVLIIVLSNYVDSRIANQVTTLVNILSE